MSEADQTSISEAKLTSTSTVPNLADCEDVKYESRNHSHGLTYKTSEGNEQWIPVVRRIRKKQKVHTDSDSSESEVDMCHAPDLWSSRKEMVYRALTSTEGDLLYGRQLLSGLGPDI